MTTEIGYFTPRQAERVWRNSLAFEKQSRSSTDSDRQFISSSISFINRSGFSIPPYGCIQISGSEEIGGRNYLVVKRPIQYTSAVIGPFLLNNDREVEDADFGTAQLGPIYRAISDGGTYTAGTRMGPTADSFDVSKGCLFSYIGEDDIETDCIRLIACETPLLAVAGASGIAANSSGTVTAKQAASGNWTSGSITYTAWCPTSTPITANATVLIFPVDAKWVAVEVC